MCETCGHNVIHIEGLCGYMGCPCNPLMGPNALRNAADLRLADQLFIKNKDTK